MVHINNLKSVLKDGWVAKDKNGRWWWYLHKPKLMRGWDEWSGCLYTCCLTEAFNIEDDEVNWKKSCQKAGE